VAKITDPSAAKLLRVLISHNVQTWLLRAPQMRCDIVTRAAGNGSDVIAQQIVRGTMRQRMGPAERRQRQQLRDALVLRCDPGLRTTGT